MYPNQPTPLPVPPQTNPGDYLNQIAPEQPKQSPFKLTPKLLIFAGAILVVLVIILSVTVNAIMGASRGPLQQLSARLSATQEIVTSAEGNLKSSQLRSDNSSLKIYLTNTIRASAEPLASAGVDVTNISDSVKAKESAASTLSRLEDARLNAIYDRTYAREMAYQLSTLIALLQQIYRSSNNTALKTFVEETYNNLQPTQESFEDFNAAED